MTDKNETHRVDLHASAVRGVSSVIESIESSAVFALFRGERRFSPVRNDFGEAMKTPAIPVCGKRVSGHAVRAEIPL